MCFLSYVHKEEAIATPPSVNLAYNHSAARAPEFQGKIGFQWRMLRLQGTLGYPRFSYLKINDKLKQDAT